MKATSAILLLILYPGIGACLLAQDLEIDGSAKITDMSPATPSAQPVGREPDGTLSLMDVSETTYSVGDYAHGGVVFWVTPSGKHGRVAHIYNIEGVSWSDTFAEIGKSARSDIHGAGNSIAIVSQSGHSISTAKLCLDLAFSGYDDWYLPAKEELNLLYINKAAIEATSISHGGESFLPSSYWSSTESDVDTSEAWYQNFFGAGVQGVDPKTGNPFPCRPIRAF